MVPTHCYSFPMRRRSCLDEPRQESRNGISSVMSTTYYFYVRSSYPAPIPSHDSMFSTYVNVESKKNSMSSLRAKKISIEILLKSLYQLIVHQYILQ